MNPIQFLLVGLLGLGFIIYFGRLRSNLADRLGVGLIVLGGAVLVIWPELSNRLAALVGVGRGVDLVLYLGFIGFFFVLLMQYTKIRELEDRLTQLTRNIALDTAKTPDNSSEE